MSASVAEGRASRHASCVAFDGRGVMLLGPSGSGKSGLALELIALGAELVADDLTCLERRDNRVFALAPPRMRGVLEARGVGLIRAPLCPRAELVLVVDMGQIERDRLPHNHVTKVLGVTIETIYKIEASYLAAAIRQLVLFGRHK